MKMLCYLTVLCVLNNQAWADESVSEATQAAVQPGETIYNSKMVVACTLVKASYKGTHAGFFSFSEAKNKSVEAYCHTRNGGVFQFSASEEQLESLNKNAGRDALVYMSTQKKLENAQSDWVMLDIKPADHMQAELKAVCGPPPGKKLYEDDKTWSRGFRLAQIYLASEADDGWMLLSLEGKNSQDVWGKEISVQLGRFCNAYLHDLITINEPMVYHYLQLKENGPYYIESVQRLILTPKENNPNNTK